MKSKILFLAVLTALSSASARAGDEPLKPTWTYPDETSGTTIEGYEYQAKSPLRVAAQTKKRDATGAVESATGSFSFDGDAARLLFERMENPVKKEVRVETDPKMAGTHEFRTGEAYMCAKRAWANGRIDYGCSFNFTDVRTGALRVPSR